MKSEHKYYTRYGVRTAKEAANDVFDHAVYRMEFLKEALAGDGNGISLTDSASLGLASILYDIQDCISDASAYYYTGDGEPGKIGNAPVWEQETQQ